MLSTVAIAAILVSAPSEAKPVLDLRGAFVEACSCEGTCTFETAGRATGCHALGAYRIDRGSYGQHDLAGSRLAFVITASGDVFTYVDGPSNAKRLGASALARVLWKDFGKWHDPKRAEISLVGSSGSHSLKINGGAVANLTTSPVKGGDGKSFVKLGNVMGDPYDSLMQASVKSGSFRDYGQEFTLKGTSAFFADPLVVRKQL
jgi:hypothetical protein